MVMTDMIDLDKNVYTTLWKEEITALSRPGTSDESTLISCIKEDEYQINKLPVGGVAIDIGSHIGASSLPLLNKRYFVYMVEMLPENNGVAIKNLAANNFSSFEIFGGAITLGDKENIFAFYADTSSEVGKIHKYIGTTITNRKVGIWGNSSESVKVRAISLDEFFKLYRIRRCNFLKVDVEAGEWNIFRNVSKETLRRIDRIAVEIESEDVEVTSTEKFHTLLGDDFIDVSKEYFPKWSDPSMIVHGYYINKRII